MEKGGSAAMASNLALQFAGSVEPPHCLALLNQIARDAGVRHSGEGRQRHKGAEAEGQVGCGADFRHARWLQQASLGEEASCSRSFQVFPLLRDAIIE